MLYTISKIVFHPNLINTTFEIIMKIGYARVSSFGQSLEVQLEKLKDCDKIFQEKQSARTDDRKELQNCLEFVRDGDTLFISRLDRLARNTRNLLNIMDSLDKKNVKLNVIDQNIDTNTSSGKLLFTMLGAIAEFENDLRASRIKDGIEAAKERNVKFGRAKSLNDKEVIELNEMRKSGISINNISSHFTISRASVYRYLTTMI